LIALITSSYLYIHRYIHTLFITLFNMDPNNYTKSYYMANQNQNQNRPMLVSKIGIIGAGVSGLAAAKQLSHHNPIVFEASDSIGGVWSHCSYNSTRLQSHRRDYEFTDFPWPQRDNPNFPTHFEILNYLHSYAHHFDIFKNIRFNSKVLQIRFSGNREVTHFSSLLPGQPVWEVAVRTNNSDTIQVCTNYYLLKNHTLSLGFHKFKVIHFIHD